VGCIGGFKGGGWQRGLPGDSLPHIVFEKTPTEKRPLGRPRIGCELDYEVKKYVETFGGGPDWRNLHPRWLSGMDV